jgi:hypothetical protein
MAYTKIHKLILQNAALGAVGPAVGAQVSIFLAGTTTLAQTYSDRNGTTLTANPITIGASGYVSVYVESGQYDMQVVNGGNTSVVSDVLAVDDIIVSGPYGELRFETVADMTAGTPINQKTHTLDPARYVGQKVSTVYHNLTSRAGDGKYVIWTLAAYRTHIGNPSWVPDGFGDHYFVNTDHVAVLQNDGEIDVLQFGVVFDANLTLQTGTDNTLALQAAFDASREYSVVKIHSNTGRGAFTDQVVYKGHRVYDFGHNRGGGLALKPNASATSAAVLVPDRWFYSNTALGRPVIFRNPNIYGNRNGAGNSGLGIHGLMLCNYRPIVIDPYITETDGDGIYGPKTMRNGSAITFKAVGMRLVRPRIAEVNGSCINLDDEAYSDGWLDGGSFAQAMEHAVRIVKGSGWYIDEVHTDTIRGSLLVVSTASNLTVRDWYLETYNNAADGKAAFSIGGILSDGISLRGIKGNVDAGRTGYFFDFFTSSNTTPSIVIDDVQVDFDSSLDGNLKLIRVTTGSVSPTDLHVSNVTRSPSEVFEYAGTNNVDLHDSNNVWNRFAGNVGDYSFIPGDNVEALNADKASNLASVAFSPTGGILNTTYRTTPKTNGTADYSETFPVVVQTQLGGSCLISITSHDFFNQTNRGQWVGRVFWSQDLLSETPALVVAPLYAPTGTLAAPTITINNIGTAGNEDYELSVTGTNSTANARTTVIFSP